MMSICPLHTDAFHWAWHFHATFGDLDLILRLWEREKCKLYFHG